MTDPNPPQETDDIVFETLWGRVLESWDDDKAHATLLDYALRAERLPDAAGRYRALKDDAEKGTRAQKKLDGIVVAATQLLMATKTPPREKVPWQITLSAALLCAIAMAVVTYMMLPRRH